MLIIFFNKINSSKIALLWCFTH